MLVRYGVYKIRLESSVAESLFENRDFETSFQGMELRYNPPKPSK